MADGQSILCILQVVVMLLKNDDIDKNGQTVYLILNVVSLSLGISILFINLSVESIKE